MVGLTNESPTFCFDRDELSTTDFNVDAFVVKYKREVGLEKLRDDLDLFLRVLKSSMVELINRDFADFLNLSTNLVGFDKSITTLKNPLTAMKTDLMKINETLSTQRQEIEEKIREQKAIRQRKQVIQSIIDVQKSIQQLNELDDAINLSKIDISEMIERAVAPRKPSNSIIINISKWFIRPDEIFSIKNLHLLNITSDIMNDIETDKNNNYWKYYSYDEIREKLLNKYRISQESFIVLYTKEKLMMVARFAWLLYWIGYKHIKILIGQIDPSLFIMNFSQVLNLPNLPLRPEVRLTCDQLSNEFLSQTTKFIDVRTYKEYSGEITGYSYIRRSGHIPNFQYDSLDGLYAQINGDITWNELENYLKIMSNTNTYDNNIKKIIYMCGTGWRASLAAIFAEELNLACTISVLDSGWFEWSEEYLK
ncbi:unnamed protein product [Rotaria sp. Silwood1]|nr:unnamed protein product [Rotaria sp. Silwood1]